MLRSHRDCGVPERKQRPTLIYRQRYRWITPTSIEGISRASEARARVGEQLAKRLVAEVRRVFADAGAIAE